MSLSDHKPEHISLAIAAIVDHHDFTIIGLSTDGPRIEMDGESDPPTETEIEAKIIEVMAPRNIEATKNIVVGFADQLAEQITGSVPLAEKLAWTDKRDAATAYIAATHTPAQEALLQGELDITGQIDGDLATLANKIIVRADLYAQAVGKIAGVRRATMAAIDALGTTPTQEQLDAVVDAAKTQAEAEFATVTA